MQHSRHVTATVPRPPSCAIMCESTQASTSHRGPPEACQHEGQVHVRRHLPWWQSLRHLPQA
eukprot:7481522-Alexandrium_andersonii.AAC.1